MSSHRPLLSTPPGARRRWRVTGQVQGVGFRPFVYRLARELGLTGFVKNDAAGVLIEAQGPEEALRGLTRGLEERRPALARIGSVVEEAMDTVADERGFVIQASADGVVSADVTVDTATCTDCLREMRDPKDRRHGYGLINCTHCGPRFTIVRRVPYDRPNTTMAGFLMCPECRGEYEDPGDRRFHAQPVACWGCGPGIGIRVQGPGSEAEEAPDVYPGLRGEGTRGVVRSAGEDTGGTAIREAARRLVGGEILAVKGLGGFHLAVRGDPGEAVERLREMKRRDRKPFALMCADMGMVRELVEVSAAGAAEMMSAACPIVLATRKAGAAVAVAVAPGMHRLGVMLAYTPIHHLLFDAMKELGARVPLVMTSANVSDEPLVTDNEEAVRRLGGMCDAILWHDRPIQRPVDDSVMIDGAGGLLPVRRARGYVPGAIDLGMEGEDGLCVGGELKNTVAVVRGRQAILSHHLGDLTHVENYECFQRTVEDMQALFAVKPRWIAHDLHPGYLSTIYAKALAQKTGARLIGVQHHHAHAAAAMAEHGVERALAVVCDGVGYGADGTMWGGELLAADLRGYWRLARLRPLMLAGGDAAARDTRRCGLALLHQAYGDGFDKHPMAARLVEDEEDRSILCGMVRGGFQSVRSSAAGRVFDGVAALLGVCGRNSFEAEAGMRLEALAWGVEESTTEGDLFELVDGDVATIDLSRLIRMTVERIEGDWPAGMLSALAHDQMARAWDAAVARAAEATGIDVVALTGGVFNNQRLTDALSRRLEARGLRVLRHRLAPAGDGGVALGQAAVARSAGSAEPPRAACGSE